MKSNVRYHTPSLKKALGVAITLAAVGMALPSHASAVLTGFEYLGGDAGSLDSVSINNTQNTIDLAKTFNNVTPMTLRITVAHGTGSGGPFAMTETITNGTTANWTDFHLRIEDSGGGNVVFTNFNSSTLSGFTLDAAPASGPDKLNFTGNLAMGGSALAAYNLNFSDPGAGNTYTVDLVQTATINGGGNPVPVPMASYLFGSALLGLGLLKRKRDKA